jgi:oligoribonuclease NrnB/cAMP/cGMP phosphodiesterase (DHH superfamily)
MPKGWLVTHDRCLDGATAAVIGEAVGLTPVFAEPDRVEQKLSSLSLPAAVFLADVSLPRDAWPRWGSAIAGMFDHHQSALPLRDCPGAVIDLAHAGSFLWYRFCVEQGWLRATDAWQRLVHQVERHDLWRWDHEEGTNLNRLFHALGYDWFRVRFGHGWTPYTAAEGDLLADLIAQEKDFIQDHLKQTLYRTAADGRQLAAISLAQDGATNELAHTLIARGVDLVVMVKPDGRLSARSSERVNAADLMAALFSGGGHARAAGGRLPQTALAQPNPAEWILGQVCDALNQSSK